MILTCFYKSIRDKIVLKNNQKRKEKGGRDENKNKWISKYVRGFDLSFGRQKLKWVEGLWFA